jgi:hypothetical protein
LRNSLARKNINGKPSVVEVLDVDGTTSQSCNKLNVAVVKKVVIPASKAGMGLLLNLENDVASLDARRLVTLASELNLGAAANTLVDVNVEDLAVDGGLLSIALLAAILLLDDLALSVAVRADSLEALDHGAHLAHHRLHAMAVTASASLDSTLLATETLTLGANNRPLESKLRDLTSVDIFQGNLVGVVDGAGLGGATVHTTTAKHAAHATETTTTEELSKQVLGSHSTTAGTSLEAGLTILIVDLSLLRVGENFVGVRDFLELLFGIGVVCVLVYVALGMLN